MLNKKLAKMIIDLFVTGIFLYYLIIIWSQYPFSIGGTLIFAIFIGIATYISIRLKKFAFELSLFSLIPLLLMVLNFLAYIENKNGFSSIVMLSSIAITLLLHWIMIFLATQPFNIKEEENLLKVKKDFIKRISYLFAQSGIILIPFLLATAASFMAIKDTNNSIIESHFPSFISFCLFWLLISLMFNLLILIRKRKFIYKYFANIVQRKTEGGNKLFRWFFIMMILTIVIGSGFEMQRGYWFVWLMSCSTLITLILVEWRIWQFVFLNIDHTMPSINLEEINTILSVKEFLPTSIISLKKFVTLFLTLLFYIFILLMVSSYFKM